MNGRHKLHRDGRRRGGVVHGGLGGVAAGAGGRAPPADAARGTRPVAGGLRGAGADDPVAVAGASGGGGAGGAIGVGPTVRPVPLLAAGPRGGVARRPGGPAGAAAAGAARVGADGEGGAAAAGGAGFLNARTSHRTG